MESDLVTAIFNALDLPVNIEYIDLPPHLSEKYQYYTKAELDKIKKAGYNNPFHLWKIV
jgi:ADP-L-glycero-D-manno-heptose 6-epimerase